jgi:ABC-2 type transport system permease protein
MVVYMAQLSICVPLAFATKKPVLVVAIYYGFTIFCAQLSGLRNSSPALDKVVSYTPFGGNYTFVTLDTGTGDYVKAIVVCFVFIMLMLAVTYSIFRKLEIK